MAKKLRSGIHLHVHSDYSLLDSTCRIERLAELAAHFEQPALALTDDGVLTGAFELQEACERHGVKPIFGVDAYVGGHDRPGQGEFARLTLLAETDQGYRNLIALSSAGFVDGYRDGRPTVDLDLLDRHATGIIALTGLDSAISRAVIAGDRPAARKHADDLLTIFGADSVYFGVQSTALPRQQQANAGVVRLANELGQPLVATTDVHYPRPDDHRAYLALVCVRTGTTLADPALSGYPNDFYLRNGGELRRSFAEWRGAVETTLEVAERCSARLEARRTILPPFPTPAGSSDAEHLGTLAERGLRDRYGDPAPAAATQRLAVELAAITDLGFEAYFLIIGDLVRHARNEGVVVGPGRGAAAGSIVCYCLGITDVDPLAHGLLFERLLNPDRGMLPDIDLDFAVSGRDRLTTYLRSQYGESATAQVVTYGRTGPRAALQTAARALGREATGNWLAQLVPDPVYGRWPSFDECMGAGDLASTAELDPASREIIELARGFEGMARLKAPHACAFVIADRPLREVAPVELVEDSMGEELRTVTQYSMRPVEQAGLLKLDLLGLRALDAMGTAIDDVERKTGTRIDLEATPLDDAATYELLASGDTDGVFHFGAEGMQSAARLVQPSNLTDVAALISMYRPGALSMISAYAARKADPQSVEYVDPRLEPILGPTHGLLLFQEQAMEIAMAVAGFSATRADELRRVCGKKYRARMAELWEDFSSGALETGAPRSVTDELWTMLTQSADWSFNRAHAVSYAVLAYRSAWLMVHHGEEYRAALALDPD